MTNTKNIIFKFLFVFTIIHFTSIKAQRVVSNAIEVTRESNLLVNVVPATSNASCTAVSEAYLNKYRLQSFYVPKKNDPVITLKITIHIFKPLADTGIWQMNNNTYNGLPAMRYMLDSITNGHQERYSFKRNASYMQDADVPYIQDSKIQFEVTNIYFYSDLDLYRTTNDAALLSTIEKTDPKRLEEGLPIVFNCSGGPGHLVSYNGNAAVVTTLDSYSPVFSWSHLSHEIGHTFGLGHTYINAGGAGSEWQNFEGACGSIDYLSDVFLPNNPFCSSLNTVPVNPPCFSCCEIIPDTSNNIMSGARYNRWISPLQMGRRIRSMHFYIPGRNIRLFAKDTESDHKSVWTISKTETWDFDIQMYRDIVVKNGATLVVKCKIAMAINGKIKLEKNAKLIVDGGEITGWCKTGNWLGVETPAIKKKKPGDKTPEPVFIKLTNGGLITKAQMQMPLN